MFSNEIYKNRAENTQQMPKKLFHCVNSNMAYQRFELAAFLLNNPNQMTQTTRFYPANKMSNFALFRFENMKTLENGTQITKRLGPQCIELTSEHAKLCETLQGDRLCCPMVCCLG